MPDILIERHHTLGFTAAREAAREWVRQAETDYGLACIYTEGEGCDKASFARAGVDGSVEVTADSFRLHAVLGFLYGNFSAQITQRLNQNLDALLGVGNAEEDGYNDDAWK